jgi:hypothetical protein
MLTPKQRAEALLLDLISLCRQHGVLSMEPTDDYASSPCLDINMGDKIILELAELSPASAQGRLSWNDNGKSCYELIRVSYEQTTAYARQLARDKSPAKFQGARPNIAFESSECDHPAHKPDFDEEVCRRENLSASEVRKRYPRLGCPKCGAICYASTAHYVYGDW